MIIMGIKKPSNNVMFYCMFSSVIVGLLGKAKPDMPLAVIISYNIIAKVVSPVKHTM